MVEDTSWRELLNIRKVPREFTRSVLIFAFIYSFTDYYILTEWNLRPPRSWWGINGIGPIAILDNIIIPILLILVVYRRNYLLSDQGSLGRFCLSVVVYGGVGVFASTLLGLLYPRSGNPTDWGSILDYAIWRTITYTPKLVFPSLIALMYGRIKRTLNG